MLKKILSISIKIVDFDFISLFVMKYFINVIVK